MMRCDTVRFWVQFLHVSGQLGLNPETMNFVSDNVIDQAKKALENMGR